MLPGVLALGTATVLSQFLAAIGVPRTLIVVWALALALVLGVGRLLIPHHAGAGAAVALSITYGALLLMVGLLVYRFREHEVGPAATLVQLDVSEAHGGTA
jgi:O-antigen/teichoic acid export membrane protein